MVVKVLALVGPVQPAPITAVGIELGLKTFATAFTGQKIEGRFYRALECTLGIAQRDKQKQRTNGITPKSAQHSAGEGACCDLCV